ncbi:unnamed protein product [Cuscuta europaea]|uniref:Uncharacterized protein n=1 Tax=Cuscuta europaea TaxID=41803 RepID=A0A9P0YNE6_CUSEU|nr:unnamed protein product [Cuscuta europaea]
MTITATTPVIAITASTHFPVKLTNSNFPVRKCQVHSALIGLGIEGYVDGTIKAPDQYLDDAKTQPNPCYAIWYRQDRTIISALIGSCSETIQPLISSASTARHAWDKLALTYASASRGRIISLKSTLARTIKGNRSITAYLAEMYALSEALALAQNPISDEDLVVSILKGLGSDYGDIKSAVRVRESALPLAELQDILLEQENDLQEASNVTQTLVPTANVTTAPSHTGDRRHANQFDRRGNSTHRGRGAHHGRFSRNNSSVTCRFCDIPGHEVK